MIYDHLTPEQSQRAEALHAAATAFGSPSTPTEDYLVRAAQWVITGEHPAITPAPAESAPEDEIIYEGGGVNQLATESDTADEKPLTVGKDFSKAQSGPALDEVETTKS